MREYSSMDKVGGRGARVAPRGSRGRRRARANAPDDGELLLELGGVAIETLVLRANHEASRALGKADTAEHG